MTTLASAVAIGDNQLVIDAPLSAGQIPGWVKIDSELFNVGGQHFRTGTTLVLSSPARATHSQGATVTYAGRPFDSDFLSATGGGGGSGITVDNQDDPPASVTTLIAPGAVLTEGQADLSSLEGVLSLSLLGPITVNWNSANVRTSGFKVFDLTANQTVIWLAVRIVTAWGDAAENGHFILGGTLYAPPDEDYQTMTEEFNLSITTPAGDGYFVANEPFHASVVFAQVTTTGAILFVTNGGTSVAGQAQVFALVGTPAA